MPALSHLFRRGAVYWWRRRLPSPLPAMSLASHVPCRHVPCRHVLCCHVPVEGRGRALYSSRSVCAPQERPAGWQPTSPRGARSCSRRCVAECSPNNSPTPSSIANCTGCGKSSPLTTLTTFWKTSGRRKPVSIASSQKFTHSSPQEVAATTAYLRPAATFQRVGHMSVFGRRDNHWRRRKR